jgi:hypothetical protein
MIRQIGEPFDSATLADVAVGAGTASAENLKVQLKSTQRESSLFCK